MAPTGTTITSNNTTNSVATSVSRSGNGRTRAGGISISRTTTVEQIEKSGGVKKLIGLLKRVDMSLTAEWTDDSDKTEKQDVIEAYYKPIYGFFKKLTDISNMIGAFTEGEEMEKFNAEISVNSGIDIVEELGTDNIGPYKKNSYIFKGLNVKVVIVQNVFRRKKISVIPKIDETFEILKEDKICPDNIEYLKN